MTEENEALGMTPADARAEAVRRFGDVERIRNACAKEDAMAERRRVRIDGFRGWVEDLRYGLRVLRRSPVHAAVIVITLACGIGANAIVFSALSPYFLRALPFAEPDRLVHLFTVNTVAGYDRDRFSLPELEDLRDRSRGFESFAGYYYSSVSLSGDGGAEQAAAGRVTANTFDVLGASAAVGRTFSRDESGPAGSDVVVLGWGLWQRAFAGDRSLIGSTVRIDGEPHTVIGVMPAEFNFPFGGVKLWVPMRDEGTAAPRDRRSVHVFGRLAEGWTVAGAMADLDGIWSDLEARYPDIEGELGGLNALGMREALNFAYDVLRIAFTALVGAVLFVLMVACANIAGLGLARALVRRREVAVRAALGAPRGRLVRQFLLESAILAVAGGAIGLFIANAFMRVAGPVFPEDLYAVGEFGVDGAVVLFASAVTMVAALLIGVLPALTVTGGRPGDSLREAGRGRTGTLRSSRTRSFLVVAEMALGLVLVVGAGLMTRSLSRVTDAPLGFEPDNLLTIELIAPASRYEEATQYATFFDQVVDRTAGIPGVSAASAAAVLPLNHEIPNIEYVVPGQAADGERPIAQWFGVSPGWFAAMNIEQLAGRDFGSGDTFDGERVALVNRAFVERNLAGRPIGDAVGATVRLASGDSTRAYRVIGVVGDVRHSRITEAPPPQIYVSLDQVPQRRRFVVARYAGEPGPVASGIRDAVAAIDPDVPTNWLRPMSDVMVESIGPFTAMSLVLGVFGGFALLLAAIGLYGLIASSVAQRGAEFGVRLALGAQPRRLVRTVMREGLRLATIGISVGLLLALAGGRVLGSLLYGVNAADPLTLITAMVVFIGCALLATAMPAMRASRSDPVSALRSE
jgi:predicted permease